ncbi:hypothetical protein [Dolichospermum heterosporum]|uniref:Leucine rich repeat variant n=1 Tax=Dolichospermum heterosporum TAC447 TaxID=747523 RepID=A0ABY5LUT8_9CYAN|nr:hypothetical protein [Dolichospermum heterosporum]UUO14356.1 hypothetical protein NG743_20285 [Dolichospermum heterosporum TAC447]
MEDNFTELTSLEEEALNENTPISRLEELACCDIQLAELVASNPSTPPELLEKILKTHKNPIILLLYIFENPNLTIDLFMKLILRKKIINHILKPKESIENMFSNQLILRFIELEEQFKEKMSQLEEDVYIKKTYNQVHNTLAELFPSIAKNASTSPEVLEELCNREDIFNIVQSLAANANTPINNLINISQTYNIINLVVKNKIFFPEKSIDFLLEQYTKLRSNLEFIENSTSSIKQDLYKCQQTIIYHYLSNNPSSPIYFLQELNSLQQDLSQENVKYIAKKIKLFSSLNEDIGILIVNNVVNSLEILLELYKTVEGYTIREELGKLIASHPDTTLEILLELYKTLKWHTIKKEIGKLIASHPDTTPEILLELYKTLKWHTIQEEIGKLIASHPDTTPEILLELYKTGRAKYNFEITKNITTRPNTPVKILLEISQRYNIIDLIIQNKNILEDINIDLLIETYENSRKNLDSSEVSLLERKIIYYYLSINPKSNIYILHQFNSLNKQQEISSTEEVKKILQELRRIASSNKDIAILIASNPATNPIFLQELSKLQKNYELSSILDELRKSILINPNTPIQALLNLGRYYPEMLFERQEWPLILTYNPLKLKISSETLISLLLYDERKFFATSCQDKGFISEKWLNYLTKHKDYLVRKQVARHPNASIEILQKLANDNELYVRSEILDNYQIPTEILDKLSDDIELSIRRKIANSAKTPTYLLDKLSMDKEPMIRIVVALNSNTPLNVLERLSLDNEVKVRGSVARNINVSVNILEKLTDDDYVYVCRSVAENPNTPVKILKKLADNYDERILFSITKNPNTPAYILEFLAKPYYNSLLVNIASHVNTPISLLEKLVINLNNYKEDIQQDLLLAISSNTNTPLYLLEKIIENGSYSVVKAVASNTNTPLYLLEKIIENGSYSVVEAIINNPNTTINMIEKLSKTKDEYVIQILAASNKTPDYILHNLANSYQGKWQILRKIAGNYNTPMDILENLSNDHRKTIRETAIKTKLLKLKFNNI